MLTITELFHFINITCLSPEKIEKHTLNHCTAVTINEANLFKK